MIGKTFIYSLTDPLTGHVRYIGKSNNPSKRFKSHLCIRKKDCFARSKNWISSLKEIGLAPTMEIVDKVNHNEWEFWETYYISLYKSWGFDLTNHQIGGGYSHEFCKFSEETKLKMSLAQLGKKHTPEAKEKQRLKQIGVSPSNETRAKLRLSHLGKKQPLSAIAKTVKAKEKPVIQFDLITGEKIAEYESARKAKDALNGRGNNLTNHLKGNRKSYMGYRFEYKNKE
jgi:group I intron endonuclease